MSRYERECRFRFRGDVRLAQTHIPAARNVLGLLYTLLAPGVTTGALVREVSPGVVVRASLHDGMPIIEIDARGVETGRAPTAPEERWGLWVPEGFVLYPASDTAPNGWGLPIIQEDNTSPYDPVNLAPGLDTNRWTKGAVIGEVLVTKRPRSDFVPRNTRKAPLMYETGVLAEGYGILVSIPNVTPPVTPDGEWSAYRVELTDFDGDTQKQHMFELFNAHRASVGQIPLGLPFSQAFDSAQMSSDIMRATQVTGHFYGGWPSTWKKPDDRVAHDGVRLYGPTAESDDFTYNSYEIAYATAFTPIVHIGTDPSGNDIIGTPNSGPSVTPGQAVAGWLDSPPHKAAIERDFNDASAYGEIGVVDIGMTGNHAAAHIYPTNNWVMAGSRQWVSRDPDIPVLSWDGFPNISLAWETLPWKINSVPPSSVEDTFDPTQKYDFATSYGGARWTTARRFGELDGWGYSGMTRNLYMGGRCIGFVPDNGLVWAAAIQTRIVGEQKKYRLVVLAHQDDASGSALSPTAFLTVWYADLPSTNGGFEYPKAFLRGEYGAESTQYPWDEPNSDTSWRRGPELNVQIDSSGGEYWKYNSQWVFDSQGRKAICTRSLGGESAYRDLRTNGKYRIVDGLQSAAIQITFDESPEGELEAQVHFFGAPACESPVACYASLEGEPGPLAGIGSSLTGRILAAGYDAFDNPKYCFSYNVTLEHGGLWDGSEVPHYRGFVFSGDYAWVPPCAPVGVAGVELFSSTIRAMEGSWRRDITNLYATRAVVLDVKDEVVIVTNTPPKHEFRWADAETFPTRGINPDFPVCWVGDTTTPFVTVRVWRGGELLGEQVYTNKFAALPAGHINFYSFNGTDGPRQNVLVQSFTANEVAHPSYATNGEDWVITYFLMPSPQTQSTARDPALWSGASVPLPGEPACVASYPLVVRDLLRTSDDTSFIYNMRGPGHSYSSITDHNGLVSITNTPGANPRFLYARAV